MPDRKMAIIGAPNFVAQSYTSAITAAYPGAALTALMPLSNLLTDEPSDIGRLLTRDPLYTFFHFGFDYGNTATFVKELAGLGLVNVNGSRFGKYRVVAWDVNGVGPLNLCERLAPNTESAPSNRAGALGDVDENPFTPDGAWMSPAVGTTWETRLGFATPSASPKTGTARQSFVLWVRRQGSETSYHPLVRVYLYEGGVQRADLGWRVITNSTGQTLIFRWDASLLSTTSGADAEIRMVFTGLSNATGELGAVSWQCETANPGFDSGWLNMPFDASSASWGGTTSDEAGPAPVLNLSYLPAAAWENVKHFAWLISDDGADDTSTWSSYAPAGAVVAPTSYVQAGVAVAGPAFIPSVVNFARGPLLGSRDTSVSGQTIGGQEYGSRRRPRRVVPVRLPQLTEAEGYDLFQRIDWRKGKKLPVLVIKFPDGSANALHLTSVWATLEDLPGLEIPPALGRHSWSGLLVEKL